MCVYAHMCMRTLNVRVSTIVSVVCRYVLRQYVGSSLDHYRCISAYVPSTQQLRVCDTVQYFPHTIPFPITTDMDSLKQAAEDILSLLAKPKRDYLLRTTLMIFNMQSNRLLPFYTEPQLLLNASFNITHLFMCLNSLLLLCLHPQYIFLHLNMLQHRGCKKFITLSVNFRGWHQFVYNKVDHNTLKTLQLIIF